MSATFSDARDDGPAFFNAQLAGGVVVQKEQGFRALDDQIVDAHGNKVDPDRVMDRAVDGKFKLGAHAIGARYQQRIAKARGFQVEQAAKAAESPSHAAAGRRFG